MGFDWGATKWPAVTSQATNLKSPRSPWKGLIRGGTTEHVIEALSPALAVSTKARAWLYPGAWSTNQADILYDLGHAVEFEPALKGNINAVPAGGSAEISLHVVDNSGIQSVTREWNNGGRGGNSTDGYYRVWLAKSGLPLDKSSAIGLTPAIPLYAGQWTMKDTPPKSVVDSTGKLPKVPIPSTDKIIEKWGDWPDEFFLIVELSDGRLKDLYPANNTCHMQISLDGEDFSAFVAPVNQADSDGDGSEAIRLDGTGSGPTKSIKRYQWSVDGTSVGEGATLDSLTITLPVGQHRAVLVVTDALGKTDTSSADVQVLALPPYNPNSSTDRGPIMARDPNALTGPAGYGPPNFVSSGATFPYKIEFENDPTANAPAQFVTITNNLAANLNWSTFQLTGIGFGDKNLAIPTGSQHYQTAVAMTYNGQTFNVEIEAGLHSDTGQVYAIFQSIDPNTSLPPASVFTGFLPPEDGTGRGQGYLTYTVSPKAEATTGTVIPNVATIIFDGGEIIATNQVDPHDASKGTDTGKEARVTIDANLPVAQVAALPGYVTGSFLVSWSGSGGAGGSGIASYTVYVSSDGGLTYVPWLINTTLTSATYNGVPGRSYKFYAVATSNVGNVQSTDTQTPAGTHSLTRLDYWRWQNFNIPSNTGIAADIANPTNDGYPNLLKYATGLNPLVANTTPLLATHMGSNVLTVTFPRDTSANDVTMTVEVSDALDGPWTTLARSALGATVSPSIPKVAATETGVGAVRTVTVLDLRFRGTSKPAAQFYRLNVSY